MFGPIAERIDALGARALDPAAAPLTRDEGIWLMQLPEAHHDRLFGWAERVRESRKGKDAAFCSILNVKSGNCSEDCGFCSQSGFAKSEIPKWDLMTTQQVLKAAEDSARGGSTRFGIVAAWKGIGTMPDRVVEQVCDSIRALVDQGKVVPDASLGLLTRPVARKLKEAGLKGYHHNLETSRRFYPNVCTTMTYDERIETIRIAKETGFYCCNGGIFGMGESVEDRVDLALELRDLGTESVPVNFLVPSPGTPFEKLEPLDPQTCLAITAVLRLLLPDADVRVCGGRPQLGDRQKEVFAAGANGIMVGNYLTRTGREVEDDRAMVAELGMQLERCCASEGGCG